MVWERGWVYSFYGLLLPSFKETEKVRQRELRITHVGAEKKSWRHEFVSDVDREIKSVFPI